LSLLVLIYPLSSVSLSFSFPLSFLYQDELVTKWEYDFTDYPHMEGVDLVLGANYLQIDALLELAVVKMSTVLVNKDAKTIRDMFGIVNDFAPGEEEERERKFAEEDEKILREEFEKNKPKYARD
jgi:hypothetical protein